MRAKIYDLADNFILDGLVRQQTDAFMVIQCNDPHDLEEGDAVMLYTFDDKAGVSKYKCVIKSMSRKQVTVYRMAFMVSFERRSTIKVKTNFEREVLTKNNGTTTKTRIGLFSLRCGVL